MKPISEQTVLITGATDGLGRYVAGELAAAGATVVAHGRNADKLEQTRSDLVDRSNEARVETVLADLSDLVQVDQMASEVLERFDGLDVLVNNAGIGFGTNARETSAQGYELRFAVNYLAGYLLTRRLLRLLVSSSPARIVNVSSVGQEPIDFEDPMMERSYKGVAAYRRSKLAQVMFTIDLADELDASQVTANCLHPATFMDTPMVRNFGGQPMSTVEEGGTATLHLVTDPQLQGTSGRYFDGLKESRANPQAYDAAARAKLRDLSEDLVRKALQTTAS